ncbi:MAG: hypothetical protein ACYDER_07810 [Ktedonobacteraceae bacterium]
MSPSPAQQHQAEQKESRDVLLQYVEELRSKEEYPPGDAWISLTDAARVTRTSEAMTRRWVTSGRLKVKKEAVGIPPRTRLVRLSDVAAIRPIVDPTAAITGDVRKLDLASIPRQQLQIMEDHQGLTKLMQDVLDAVSQHEASTRAAFEQVTARFHELATEHEQFAEETRQTWQVHQQYIQRVCDGLMESLHHFNQSLHQELAELRDQLAGQLEETRGTVAAHHSELERLTTALSSLQHQLQEARDDLAARLVTEHETQGRKFEEVSTRLTQVAHDLAALEKQFQEVSRTIEQTAHDLTTDIEALSRDQAQDVATLTEHLERLTQRMEQVATRAEAVQITALGYQKRADAQDRLIQTLTTSLQEECEARKTLSEQLAAQQEQVQALRREVNGRPRQKG